jgi:hypothetical protein
MVAAATAAPAVAPLQWTMLLVTRLLTAAVLTSELSSWPPSDASMLSSAENDSAWIFTYSHTQAMVSGSDTEAIMSYATRMPCLLPHHVLTLCEAQAFQAACCHQQLCTHFLQLQPMHQLAGLQVPDDDVRCEAHVCDLA